MSQERARHLVLQALHLVAPSVDAAGLDAAAPLREQVGLDAFDVAELAALLSDALHEQIPVGDYPHLATIESAVAYLAPKLPEPPGPPQ